MRCGPELSRGPALRRDVVDVLSGEVMCRGIVYVDESKW